MRQRAAFLHIAKCAGTSVEQALIKACGAPTQPDQQFDSCYVAGFAHPDQLSAEIRSTVAWDDRPTGIGPYVFHNHWSLPTLRQSFAAADIATVLREPRLRVLSYLEYNRSLPAGLHRAWLPDTTPTDMARLSLVEALELPAGARATDNLITRQVLWGDTRIPQRGFIDPALAAELAADAIAALEQLGVVTLVEHGDAMWRDISSWLGTSVLPTHQNRTSSVPMPGILRSPHDVELVLALLTTRSAADRLVWQHFAGSTTGGDDAVHRRLAALQSTAFTATYRSGGPVSIDAPALMDEALADAVDVLLVGVPPQHVPSGRRTTVVADAGQASEADTVIELHDAIPLRHVLAGRSFDALVVGDRWPLAAAFLDEVADDTPLITVTQPDQEPNVAALFAVTGWYEHSRRVAPDGSLVIARRRGDDPRRTRYSLPVVPGNTGDSRWLVQQMSANGTNILEIGCSDGLMTRAMAARGQHIVGVEFDPAAAESAGRFARRMIVADLDQPDALAPLGDERFDMVLVADVLEYLRFPTATLQRTLQHLSPGGSVLISISNLAHADVRMALLDGRVPYAELGLLDRTKIHWFTYDSVMQLLTDCGLVVTEWQRTVRAPGDGGVPYASDMVLLNQELFADDTDATTFQWILRCQRASEATAVPDPLVRHNPRRHGGLQATPGIKASARLLVHALLRRVRRGRRRGQ